MGRQAISGVAPRAYIGNYKALTIPTDADVGLDGNAPELVAAVEAAVTDGMDVVNLSLGQPAEIEPTRDILALALDAAAAAGVVPVVAAGNDFESFGRGSVISPGSSEQAITVAAAAVAQGPTPDTLASFSAAGPSDMSLRLKPDVTAPGVGILSSMPGGFGVLSGTSMATPHVAGAAALLKQRHPSWTVQQLKAALVGTARPVRLASGTEALPTRSGGGAIDLVAADQPVVLAAPSAVSFGMLERAATATARIAVADAGGGEGAWDVAVDLRQAPVGTTVTAGAPTVVVPGSITVTVAVGDAGSEGELSGYVTLAREGKLRRVPFWGRVTVPKLSAAPFTPLRAPGTYAGDTAGRPALVTTYRYPEVPEAGPVTARLNGPEQLFRITLARPVANFGVAITRRARGVEVEPRVVVAGDESRLVGHTGLPLNLNPYLVQFFEPVLAAGAVRPAPGTFDVVFDSPTPAGAGSFSFRFWVDDVRPPTAKLLTKAVRRGTAVRIRLADAGSGVDPATISARIDGRERNTRLGGGILRVLTGGPAREAPAPPAGVGLSGVAQHGEQRADLAEHPRPRDDDHRSLGRSRLVGPVSHSSIVGSDSRSCCTLRTNSSSSVEITRSCDFRFRRSRSRRASFPTRRSSRGHSVAKTTTTALASSTIHGQPTHTV